MQMKDKFELMNIVRVSTLSDKQKNLLQHLIHRHNDEHGYAYPTTAEIAKVLGVKDSKNARRTVSSAALPVDIVRVEEVPGQNNRYFLNFEAIKALPEQEVRVNYTPRNRKKSPTLLTSEDSILTIEEGTLLTSEEDILTTEEPNGYNDYSNDYKNGYKADAVTTRVEDSPLDQLDDPSLVEVEWEDFVEENDDPTLLNREDKVGVDNDLPVEDDVAMPSHTVPSKDHPSLGTVLQWSEAEVTPENVLFYIQEYSSLKGSLRTLVEDYITDNKHSIDWQGFSSIKEAYYVVEESAGAAW